MDAIGGTGESGCGSGIRGGATTGNWPITATGGGAMKWIAAEAIRGPIHAGCRCGRAPLVRPLPSTPTRPVRPRSFRPCRRLVWMDTRTSDVSTRRGNTAIRGGQPRTVSRRRRMRREPKREDPNRPMRSLLVRCQLVQRRPDRAAGAPAPGQSAIDSPTRTAGRRDGESKHGFGLMLGRPLADMLALWWLRRGRAVAGMVRARD